MQFQYKKWFVQRFEITRIKYLHQREILIFIYQQGFLYLILILITFIAGINYANNLILGFCFLISAVLCISFYLTFKQLHQLQIEVYCLEIGQLRHSLQAVSWKHMARGQGLFIKVFENQIDQHVLQIDYAQIPCGDHEQKLSWIMALIKLCEQQRPFSLHLPKQQLASDLNETHSMLARKLLAQA